MMHSFYIARKYLLHHKWRTVFLIISISLLVFLPLMLQQLVVKSEAELVVRARKSPLLVGAKGSSLNLVMNSLYFDQQELEPIDLSAVDEINQSELGTAIPLYNQFQARKFPVIGTDPDYLNYRQLALSSGRSFARLGECIIGASVAEELVLAPDSSLVTSPESLFDIAGIYPLKMKVVGVLQPSYGPDDRAIFTDLKTTWIIQGLGHGHQELEEIDDPTQVIRMQDSTLMATAKLKQYNEITADNIKSFHFHGDLGQFPISSVLVFPDDDKSATILEGRFLDQDQSNQIVRPLVVVNGLLANIFKIKKVFDGMLGVVGIAALLILFLVFALSLKLRAKEIETVFKLGSKRGTIIQLLMAEIMLLLITSSVIVGILLLLSTQFSDQLLKAILF